MEELNQVQIDIELNNLSVPSPMKLLLNQE